MVRFREQLTQLYDIIRKFNLFSSRNSTENSDDEYQLKNELISTRLFICLLFTSLIILIIYTSQVRVTHTITVNTPSLEVYSSLYDQYVETLTCPCTNIAIDQGKFISLTPTFHQVCNSDFIKNKWLSYLNAVSTYLLSSDFRATGGVLFQILTSFCNLSQDAVSYSLPKFYSTRFISNDVVDMKLLNEQCQSLIDLYILTTANDFAYSFDFIRDLTFGNNLLSGLLTNFDFTISAYTQRFMNSPTTPGYPLVQVYKSYNMSNKCDCYVTPQCISPVGIFDNNTGSIIFTIPGLYTGCLLVDAMRQSNLQCLYNQTCLNQINRYIQSPIQFNATALSMDIPSRYNPSTNISQLLANLMVEIWFQNISYAAYFQQCQPIQCSYTIVGKNSAIYIITALIGLFGGLHKGLFFLTPIIVKIVRRRKGLVINRSYRQKVQNLITKITDSIRKFNLFGGLLPSIDAYELKAEKISTYIYIISMIVSCLVLLVYIATQTVTETITIKTPSFNDYKSLYNQQYEKLSCPCSEITNKYEDFLWINQIFHPICTSDFIHDNWTNYKPSSDTLMNNMYDFRPRVTSFLHVLASFCSLARGTISNELIAFNSTEMISVQLLSQDVFDGKTQQFMDIFIQSTKNRFSYNLDSIRTITEANHIMSGLPGDTYGIFEGSYPTFDLGLYSLTYNNCSCGASGKCVTNALIYSNNGTMSNPVYRIPGLYMGCYVDEAARKSILECFFNQSCIDLFKFYLNFSVSFDTKSLDQHTLSTFNTTSTVDDLVQNLMVEQWLSNNSFENYYQKCRPSSCFYTTIHKTPFIVIVTTLIGLFGGLAKVLHIVTLFILKIIKRRKQQQLEQDSQSDSQRNKTNIIQKIKHSLQNFNLFQSIESLENTDNGYQLKNELISTRLFICLLFTSLIILIIYTSQVRVTHIITVNTPSLEVYSSLYDQYVETLTCPCTNIAIDQGKFISLTPTFHQVCNSGFVDPRWRFSLDKAIGNLYVYQRDFRLRGQATFSALASVCSLSNVSISNALNDFNSSTFVSKTLLPKRTFISQVNASTNLYTNSLAYTFSRSFGVIRDTIQGNGLFSAVLSSVTVVLVPAVNWNGTGPVGTVSRRYKTYNNGGGTCSCHDSVACSEPQYVYTNNNNKVPLYTVPGLVIGCYGFEAMLQSNLICFFNQTCIHGVLVAINSSDSFVPVALDSSKLIYFNINSTIESLVEKAMVEKWISIIDYDNYYRQCQPIYCTYTYETKNDIIYIVTTLFALIGGLTSVLQFIVPRFIKLFRKILLKQQQKRITVNIIA